MKKITAVLLALVVVLAATVSASAEGLSGKPFAVSRYGMTFYPADGFESSEAYVAAAQKANEKFSRISTVLGLTEIIKAVGDRANEVYVVGTRVYENEEIIAYINFEGLLPEALEQVREATRKPGYHWSNMIANLQVPVIDSERVKSIQLFDDVIPGAWYTEAINAMTQGGLLKGRGENIFDPEATVTYGELCTILARLFDEDTRSRCFAYQPEKWSDPGFRVSNALPNHGPVEYTSADLPSAIWCWSDMMFTGMGINVTDMWPEDFTQPVYRGEAIESAMMVLKRHSSQRIIINRDISLTDIPDWEDITAQHNAVTGEIAYGYVDGNVLTRGVMVGPMSKGTSFAYTCLHTWDSSQILDAYRTGLVTGRDTAGTCDASSTLTRAELCQMLYNAGLTQAGMLHSRQVD